MQWPWKKKLKTPESPIAAEIRGMAVRISNGNANLGDQVDELRRMLALLLEHFRIVLPPVAEASEEDTTKWQPRPGSER